MGFSFKLVNVAALKGVSNTPGGKTRTGPALFKENLAGIPLTA